ncbi:uncharacterized protein LOC110026567 [Phalaenopsis equestris]|uniref:uncharacterized protein LOC110026567 n=1 Tax=Phalaenopsis equestris TaxID=78828 RepID=UPI0009E35A5B|nr:uncharacterized protein LOC110026567 [Phalaenopsis equestris]
MSAFPFHMAIAALAGASVAAFSSYYLHRRSLAELLEFALAIERSRGGTEADSSSSGGRQVNLRKEKQRRGATVNGRRRRKLAGRKCSMAELGDGLVDENDGEMVRKEKGLSRIERLPGGTHCKHGHWMGRSSHMHMNLW